MVCQCSALSSASERGIVESEHGTGRIDERSARESVVHGQVEPENTVDAGALPAAPPFADGADDAEAGGHIATGSSDSEHERADTKRAGIRSRRDVRFPAFDAESD